MTEPARGWQSLAVFVSSTFRDLDRERDLLARVVFPDLAERLRERRCHLVDIDLRWGVDTGRLPDQEAKEAEVLTVCLREIDRARPFVVVLLGDRYGWVPPAERMAALADRTNADVVAGRWSVTHLEVGHGILADDVARARSVALVRDPLPYDEMGSREAARYCDARADDSGAGDRAHDLRDLKSELAEVLGGRYRTYGAGWDGVRVDGLEGEFARVATDAIWSVLDEATRDRMSQGPLTWQEHERLALDAHLVDRGRDVLGRDGLLADLAAFALGPVEDGAVGTGRLVVGEPGIGKSAVLARLVLGLVAEDGIHVLAQAAGVTPRSTSVHDLLIRWGDELGASLGEPPLADEHGLESLRASFDDRLARVARDRRVVLVLDAVDQLGGTAAARRLTWLPDVLPANVRLVVSSTPGPDADAVALLPRWTATVVPPLDDEGAQDLVRAVAAGQGRSVPAAVLAAVVDHVDETGSSADGGGAQGDVRNPLWLTLVAGELLELGADEYGGLDTYEGSAEQRLERLLVDTVRSLPADLPGLYGALYERARDVHGRALVDAVLDLLAVSRNGLRETDLARMVLAGGDSIEAWDPLGFARMRRHLQAHLAEQEDGRWDFTHRQGRVAAASALGRAKRDLHAQIATHLQTLPAEDPLATSELTHHLLGAGDIDGVAFQLGRIGMHAAKQATVQAIASAVVLVDQRTGPAGVWRWVAALYASASLDQDARERLTAGWLVAVDPLLEGTMTQPARVAALESLYQELLRSEALVDDSFAPFTLLVGLLLRTGDLHLAGGDLEAARAVFESALTAAEATRAASSVDIEGDWPCPVCGEILFEAGASEVRKGIGKAAAHTRAHGEESMAAWLEILGSLGMQVEPNREVASVHDRLGDLCLREDDLACARHHHTEAVDVRRRIMALFDVPPGMFPAEFVAEVDEDADRFETGCTLSASLRSLAVVELGDRNVPRAVDLLDEAETLMRGLAIGSGEVRRDVRLELAAAIAARAHAEGVGGDSAAAHRAYGEAAALLRELHRQEPDAVNLTRQRVGVLQRQATALAAVGDTGASRAVGEELMAMLRSTLGSIIEDQDTLELIADALGSVAEAMALTGAVDEARDLLVEALDRSRRLSAASGRQSSRQRAVVAALIRLGGFEEWAGRLGEATRLYQEANEVLAGAAWPGSGEARALVTIAVATAAQMAGDTTTARNALEQAIRQASTALAADPADIEARTTRMAARTTLADVELQAGRAAAAAALLDDAFEDHDRLPAAVRSRAAVADTAASIHVGRADAAWSSGDLDAVRTNLEAAHLLRLGRHEEAPEDRVAMSNLMTSHGRLATLAGQLDDAGSWADHLAASRLLAERMLRVVPDDCRALFHAAALDRIEGLAAGDAASARRLLMSAVERAEAAVLGGSEDPDCLTLVASVEVALAAMDFEDHEHDSGVDHLRRAVAAAEQAVVLVGGTGLSQVADLVAQLENLAWASSLDGRPALAARASARLETLTAAGVELDQALRGVAGAIAAGDAPWTDITAPR